MSVQVWGQPPSFQTLIFKTLHPELNRTSKMHANPVSARRLPS
jgi:hypothetical protein